MNLEKMNEYTEGLYDAIFQYIEGIEQSELNRNQNEFLFALLVRSGDAFLQRNTTLDLDYKDRLAFQDYLVQDYMKAKTKAMDDKELEEAVRKSLDKAMKEKQELSEDDMKKVIKGMKEAVKEIIKNDDPETEGNN